MREAFGDLWTLPADARCVTTNGAVRNDGCAVMGRGVAAQAVQRWPLIQAVLGAQITVDGNHVHVVMKPDGDGALLVSFPVKHHWRERADLALIERSCGELMELADRLGLKTILLPRPGCGNGGLDYEAHVFPAIEPLLDDRVTVIDRRPES